MATALKLNRSNGTKTKGDKSQESNGHVAFVGDYEYYVRDNGALYKAGVSGDVMTDGYRAGRWECDARDVDRRLQMLGLKKTFRGFCKAIQSKDYEALHTVYKALNEIGGAAGGYIVPLDWSWDLLRPLSEQSIIYPRATVVEMTSAETLCPYIDATTVQAANTAPFFGGISMGWGPQKATLATNEAAEPTWRQMSMRAWDLFGYALISNQMLADMGPLGEAKLVDLFGKAAAWYAEWAWFNGAGAAFSLPLGILNAPCAIAYSRAGGGHIAQSDVVGMAARLMPQCWMNAIWCVSVSAIGDLAKVTGFTLNEWPYGDAKGIIGFLLGHPVYVTDKLPKLGTAGDLVLFDPSMYAIGDRQQVVVDISEHAPYSTSSAFQRNQSMFRVWYRGDGKPMLDGVVSLPDGSGAGNTGCTTVSCIVVCT